MKFRTIILAGALAIAPAAAFADTSHIAITCPTEAAYGQLFQQIKALSAKDAASHAKVLVVMQNNGCVDDHWHPGEPQYHILDTDGQFVIISNGINSGYMNKQDFDILYLIGKKE